MAVDRARAKPENVRELLRLSELYLDGTVQLALAADSRAMALTGVLATSSTALIAGGFALLLSPTALTRSNFALGMAAFGAGLCLLVGGWQAVSAAKPGPFSIAGNYFRSWTEDDFYGEPINPLLDQVEIYQLKVDTNLVRLRAGAAYLQRALWCVLATPLAAFIPGLVGFYVFACL